MADYDPSVIRGRTGTAAGADIDAGLRAYMLGVYNYMMLGVAFTAVVIMALGSQPELLMTLAMGPGKWVAFAGIMGLGWFAPRIIMGGSTAAAHLCYWGYAALWGVLMAPMVLYYLGQDPTIVMRAFLITSVVFGSMSLYGYSTKRDLSPFATFFFMATVGLLVAIIANYFIFQSDMFGLLISCLVVLIFSGITAWETQEIRRMYFSGDGSAVAKRKSIFGAFMLYGTFATMFIHVLSLVGFMSND